MVLHAISPIQFTDVCDILPAEPNTTDPNAIIDLFMPSLLFLRVVGNDDSHAGVNRLDQFCYILVPETDATLGCTRAD